MRGLLFCIVALVGAMVASGAAARSSGGSMGADTMGDVNYLFGAWSCSTKLPAYGKQPAQTVHGTMTFAAASSPKTISYAMHAGNYSSMGFIGWNSSRKVWWSNSVDSMGGFGSETGTAAGNVTRLAGSSMFEGQKTSSRDTITKLSQTQFRDVFELNRGGKWSMDADSTCTKQ